MTLARKVTEYYRNKPRIFKLCLQALEELLEIYVNWKVYINHPYDTVPNCPLCKLIPGDAKIGCGHCPWAVITGKQECSNLHYIMHQPKKRQARIKQLRRWIVAYKKAQEVFSWRI